MALSPTLAHPDDGCERHCFHARAHGPVHDCCKCGATSTAYKAPGLLLLIGEAIQDDVDGWTLDEGALVVNWQGKRLVVRVEEVGS